MRPPARSRPRWSGPARRRRAAVVVGGDRRISVVDIPLLAGVRDDGVAGPEVADRAARAWLAGGIVGLPTETVYGLAADAQDAEAVARVYEVKGRPADHPLIVHVQGAAGAGRVVRGPQPGRRAAGRGASGRAR